MKYWQREQMPRKRRVKRGKEDRDGDGSTALRETGKDWEIWRTMA